MTTKAHHHTAADDVSENGPQAVLEQLDPATLLVDLNVRAELALNPAFTGSVKERGVLIPIVAVRSEDGVRVRHGHRRVAAAVQAGLPAVPVVVVTAPAGTTGAADTAEAAREIDRLVDQYAENTHRAALSTGEQAEVMSQLSLLGLSITQIARRTKASKATVQAGITAAQTPGALDTAAHYDLDLTQAAALAEFADDPEAMQDLVAAAERGVFEHEVQRKRDQRTEAAAIEAAEAELREAGVSIVERSYRLDDAVPLHRIASEQEAPANPSPGDKGSADADSGDRGASEDDESGEDGHDTDRREMQPEEHRSCPGHAAWVMGRPWGPEPGATITYVCVDVVAYGHSDLWNGRPFAETRGAAAPEPDSAEAEAAREEARAARREVITNNKLWRSAETVRRTWLRTMLTRKTAPKGTPAFLLQMLTAHALELEKAQMQHHRLACDLLGLDTSESAMPGSTRWVADARLIPDALAHAGPARAQLIGLAVAVAACEELTDVHTWRGPSTRNRLYFRFLAQAGYHLSDVESLVLREDHGQAEDEAGEEGQAEAAGEDDADEAEDDPDGVDADGVETVAAVS